MAFASRFSTIRSTIAASTSTTTSSTSIESSRPATSSDSPTTPATAFPRFSDRSSGVTMPREIRSRSRRSLDHPLELARVGGDPPGELIDLLRLERLTLERHGEAQDGGQRRSKVVRHGGQERVL